MILSAFSSYLDLQIGDDLTEVHENMKAGARKRGKHKAGPSVSEAESSKTTQHGSEPNDG